MRVFRFTGSSLVSNCWASTRWRPVRVVRRSPAPPLGSNDAHTSFAALNVSLLRSIDTGAPLLLVVLTVLPVGDRHAVVGHARAIRVERARVDATARTSAREAVPEGRTLGEEVGTRLLRRLELLTIERGRRAAVAVATVRGVAAAGLGLRCAAELERPGRRRTRRRLAVAAGCTTGSPVAAAEAVGRQVDAVLLQAVDIGLHLGRHVPMRRRWPSCSRSSRHRPRQQRASHRRLRTRQGRQATAGPMGQEGAFSFAHSREHCLNSLLGSPESVMGGC